MNILWLSHLIPYPPKGGVLQRSYNMIREVSRHHKITLIAFNQSEFLSNTLPEEEDPLSVAKNGLSPFLESMSVVDVPEKKIRFGKYLMALYALLSGQAYNMRWLKSEQAARAIRDTLSRNEFDVVHVDTISLCIYFDLIKDMPVVLNHHNFESEMLFSRSITGNGWLKSLYFRTEASRLLKSEIEFCNKSDLNLTCSDEDSDRMSEITSVDNFLTVPNGVDTAYFYPKTDKKIEEKNILIVGGLSWYPNREAVEYFIREIWPVLRQEIPEVRVDIVGRGPTEEMLKLSALDERICFHGFVDDVREYLWRSEFYLCPIRTGGGTKLKILDALASGCCIIADPFSCKGIAVREECEVLYAENPSDYVRQIKRLMSDTELQVSLREAGPKLIQSQYSYDKIGALYSNAVKKLVEKEQR